MAATKKAPKVSRSATRVVPEGASGKKLARFLKVAPKRITNAVNKIRLVGNCGNSLTYSYNAEQIEKIRVALQSAVDDAMKRFNPSKEEKAAEPGFSF